MGVYLTELDADDEFLRIRDLLIVTTLSGRPRNTPVAMPALGIEQRQPPPPCHAPRLRASVRRNLSQFELDDVGIEDALGDIEDVLDGRGRGSVTAERIGSEILPPLARTR